MLTPSQQVLIVEDDPIISMLEKRMLEKLGHKVLDIIESGEEAIKYCSAHSPEIIIMDIALRGSVNGIEATKRIKDMSSHDIPVLFISGNSDLYNGKSDCIPGAQIFISKPFTEATLYKAINSLKNCEEAE